MNTDINLTDWAHEAAAEIEAEGGGIHYLFGDESVKEMETIILRHADPLIAALQSAVEERDMLRRQGVVSETALSIACGEIERHTYRDGKIIVYSHAGKIALYKTKAREELERTRANERGDNGHLDND